MPEIEEEPFPHEDGIRLLQKPNQGMPVLLLHGASARSETFTIPGPDIDGNVRCLRDWLWERGFETWRLDWRGSATVVEAQSNPKTLRDRFGLDEAAEIDIPWALRTIRKVRAADDVKGIGAIGHCLGAGALAQAIACDQVAGDAPPLTHVVLLTLGLFYIPPVFWGVLKAQNRDLELLWAGKKDVVTVDPRPQGTPWPDEIEKTYEKWFQLTKDLPHDPKQHLSDVYKTCNRLTFMYGWPYKEDQLVHEIHDDTWTLSFHRGECRPKRGWVIEGSQPGARGILRDFTKTKGDWGDGDAEGVLWLKEAVGEFRLDGEELKGSKGGKGTRRFAFSKKAIFREAQLQKQFGPIPLRMYLQAARNVLRGTQGKPKGLAGRFDDPIPGDGLVTAASCNCFSGLATTLITGKKNRLWSLDSARLMYDWLPGAYKSGSGCLLVEKPDYGHQDLLWGKSAFEDVFPDIEDALTRSVSGASSSSTNFPTI